MSPAFQMALALGSVSVLLGLMAMVRHLAGMWSLRAELQRKLVHIGTGLYALVLPWIFPDRWPVYVLVGVTMAVMLVLRLPGSRLGGTLHGVERKSYGDLLLAASVGLCLFLAGDQLFLYVLPIAVLTLADAAAALAGSTYGRRFFAVEDGQKSIEGSAVFFTVTLLVAMVCLMLMTPLAPPNILVLSLLVAAFGTLVEAASWRGFDNLFLPLGLLIFLSVHAQDPLPELLTFAAFFAFCNLAVRYVTPRIGLTNHAARVYVTAVFLLLAMTEMQNALFPILTLAAHAWCRNVAPCTARHPDLDIVAGVALVSFGWLTLGTASGWNAVSFFGLTTMGMMVSLCAVALTPQKPALRYSVMAALLAATLATRTVVIGLNPAEANWSGAMWPITVACLALSLVPMAWPRSFTTLRVTKLTLLALPIPLGVYLYAIAIKGLYP